MMTGGKSNWNISLVLLFMLILLFIFKVQVRGVAVPSQRPAVYPTASLTSQAEPCDSLSWCPARARSQVDPFTSATTGERKANTVMSHKPWPWIIQGRGPFTGKEIRGGCGQCPVRVVKVRTMRSLEGSIGVAPYSGAGWSQMWDG